MIKTRMTQPHAPVGLVLWPANPVRVNRLCVLISDVHCTDCTVGNQTVSENDWHLFFDQLQFAVSHPSYEKLDLLPGQGIDELLLILNGDIIDLIRSSKWTEAEVYPWDRDHPQFPEIVMEIMRDIVAIHAHNQPVEPYKSCSGFFYWMRKTLQQLREMGVKVTIISIVGNHDKELQVVPAARQMYYEECLGMTALDISDSYRGWVAAQLGTPRDDLYPCLPFYFADVDLRLLATHGQWRDADNSRATSYWQPEDGWQPQSWRQEQYRAFSEPCFGDTIAAGMLSGFIWRTSRRISDELPGAERLRHVLDEMDLYRPSVAGVLRLLRESRRLAKKDKSAKGLHQTVLDCFHESLVSWLSHAETWNSTSGMMKVGLHMLSTLGRLRWYWLDVSLMYGMAKLQQPESKIPTSQVLAMPAFNTAYQALGLRLHVEGHTHVALEADAQPVHSRQDHNNFTYINLGAWRDAILPKCNKGFRRRSTGRALFIFDLAALLEPPHPQPDDAFHFYTRDVTGWGDRLDQW